MIYNPDGSPMTDEQKSSEVKSNKSVMDSMASIMSSASNYVGKAPSLINSYQVARKSIASDPFGLDKPAKDRSIVANISGIKSIKASYVASATGTSSAYARLKERNDILVNGTLGGHIGKRDSAKRKAQSSQAIKVRVQSDPLFSASYSVSQSTSASLAKLDPDTRNSMLNSMANKQRNLSNYETDDPTQMISPRELHYMLKPSKTKNRGNK